MPIRLSEGLSRFTVPFSYFPVNVTLAATIFSQMNSIDDVIQFASDAQNEMEHTSTRRQREDGKKQRKMPKCGDGDWRVNWMDKINFDFTWYTKGCPHHRILDDDHMQFGANSEKWLRNEFLTLIWSESFPSHEFVQHPNFCNENKLWLFLLVGIIYTKWMNIEYGMSIISGTFVQLTKICVYDVTHWIGDYALSMCDNMRVVFVQFTVFGTVCACVHSFDDDTICYTMLNGKNALYLVARHSRLTHSVWEYFFQNAYFNLPRLYWRTTHTQTHTVCHLHSLALTGIQNHFQNRKMMHFVCVECGAWWWYCCRNVTICCI